MRSPFYWLLGLSLALMLTAVPFIYYRWEYTHSKRLRVVTEDKVYRSGQMTASGFAEAVERYQIHTIINLQDEFPDPEIALGYFTRKTIKESELCRQLGVNYVFLGPDLISRKKIPQERPPAIDKFLSLMDNPAIYPVLLHCRAGLHRTGVMVGVYRMEYEGWTRAQAIEEMKNHGFGEWPCTTANDYITQYIDTFQRGIRNTAIFDANHQLRDHKWNNWIHHQ